MARAIGIDLGTTSSCSYTVEDGRLKAIPSRDGGLTTPSVVAFTARELLVGGPARRQALINPAHTIRSVKRLLGRRHSSAEVAELQQICPYQIVEAPNGDAWVRLRGRDYSPEELVSFILQHLKVTAEDYLGEPVVEAVISVPACFDHRQRQATRAAAELAGLEVRRLISEPAAAALAYGHQGAGDGRLAVLDLGGGVFDAAILEISPGVVEVRAVAGDAFLGGDDFDLRLMQLSSERFCEQSGAALTDDPTALWRLTVAAQQAKHRLSVAESTSIDLPFLLSGPVAPLHLSRTEITRRIFESLIGDELDRLVRPCLQALEDAGLEAEQLDQLLLVGGMSRMPALRALAEQIFGLPPAEDLDPDSAVARGAALLAATLAGGSRETILIDVTAHTLSWRTADGRSSPLIERNSRIPCRRLERFERAEAGQGFVVLDLYQGCSESVTDSTCLGQYHLHGMAPSSPADVELTLDADGILQVAAETAGGHRASVEIRVHGGLTAEQLGILLGDRAVRAAPPEPPRPEASAAAAPPPQPARGAAASAAPPRPAASAATTIEPEVPDPYLGTIIGGCYQVEKVIGVGGMAKVYRAHDIRQGGPVAIKILSPEMSRNQEATQRFMQEARAAGSVRHDNTIRILDFGRLPDGCGYSVMEFLDGYTLAQMVAARGALPAHIVVTIAIQLAEGLAAVHDQQMVHRDIKPDNVTIAPRPDEPFFCKILDFGIAKVETPKSQKRLTVAGSVFGTPEYMSPEQVRGLEVDHRTDVYSLGVVLYEMAAGQPPFVGDNPLKIFLQHQLEPPPPINQPGCPRGLEAIIARCLAKDPASRYQTMRQLAADLRRLRP